MSMVMMMMMTMMIQRRWAIKLQFQRYMVTVPQT